jgi:hypothetical protein
MNGLSQTANTPTVIKPYAGQPIVRDRRADRVALRGSKVPTCTRVKSPVSLPEMVGGLAQANRGEDAVWLALAISALVVLMLSLWM